MQQILKDRFREYTEALNKRDLAALDKIWAEGYTFTNSRGEFLTKKDRMENIKSGATQFDSISREDEEIRVFGNTAVVTGHVVLKVIYSGKESSGPYRFINVWVKMPTRSRPSRNSGETIVGHGGAPLAASIPHAHVSTQIPVRQCRRTQHGSGGRIQA